MLAYPFDCPDHAVPLLLKKYIAKKLQYKLKTR